MSAQNPRPLLAQATLFELSPLQVDEGNRIGFLHEDKAAALGRLMAVDGQRDPIKVVAQPDNAELPWRLVTGMHRLIGARIEGIMVWAIEVSGKPEDLADLEASENLHRRPLGPLERAKFTAALVQAAQDRIGREHGSLNQQKVAAKARWTKVKSGEVLAERALKDESDDACRNLRHAYGWEESVGDALGMARDSIYRALTLHRMLIEPFGELINGLAQHPVVGENAAQLKAIAQVRDESARRKVIEALLADPELSADDARIQCGIDTPVNGATPLPHQKFVNAVVGNIGRLTPALQKRHLPEIVGAFRTDDVRRQLRDLLNEKLGEKPVSEQPPQPAVAIRASVKFDHLVCLECGEKMERLQPHMRTEHDLSHVQYLARWDLPIDYPMSAPKLDADDADEDAV